MNHEFEKNLYGREKAELEPGFGLPHRELCSVKDLKVFIKVGKEMGIDVAVIARAGQLYITDRTGPYDNDSGYGQSIDFHSNVVPKGSVYIEHSNEISKMFEFYTRVDALSEQTKASTKPSIKSAKSI